MFISSSQLSPSSTGVTRTVPSSSAACTRRWGPTIARSTARHSSTNTNVASGPAPEIFSSSAGVAASRLIWVIPPNRNSSMRFTSIPCRRATSACPSSWKISDAKNISAVTTVVAYTTVSEVWTGSASRNAPEIHTIIRNRIRNQVPSTPMRIPNTSSNLIEPGRRNMLQWCHRI